MPMGRGVSSFVKAFCMKLTSVRALNLKSHNSLHHKVGNATFSFFNEVIVVIHQNFIQCISSSLCPTNRQSNLCS